MTGQCRAWTTKSTWSILGNVHTVCVHYIYNIFILSHSLVILQEFILGFPPAKDWDLAKLTGRKDRYQWYECLWIAMPSFRDKLSGPNHHNPLTLGLWAYNLDSPRISVRNSQDLSAIFCSPKLNDMFHALHEPTRTNSHTPHFEHVNSSESTQKLRRICWCSSDEISKSFRHYSKTLGSNPLKIRSV